MSVDYDSMARETARILLDIGAINLRPHDPFTLTSVGKKSPAYVDCRRIISYPEARSRLMEFACTLITDKLADTYDAVAGGETAGIPFATIIADRLKVPMLYVRKKPKGHGLDRLIEGTIAANKRVLLVEDLASDGNSKFGFVDALRDQAKAEVAHCFVIFFYDIFRDSRPSLAKAGITLHALATWRDVLAVAEETGKVTPAELGELKSYVAAPEAWSIKHGGK